MKNVRRNKDPEQDINVSYQEFIKQFTTVNTENIYLDNAYIQQVRKEIGCFCSHLKLRFCSSIVGLHQSFHISKKLI